MTTPTDYRIEERVSAGAAWLDEVRPNWINEIKLDELELRNCERCVLGQIVVMERVNFGPEMLDLGIDLDDVLDGFDCLIEPTGNTEAVLADVDSLVDLVMTGDVAEERGFHLGESIYDATDEWDALTAEWRRVIVALREGASS